MEINITSLDIDLAKPEGTAHLSSQSSGPTTFFLRKWIKANLLRMNRA